MPFKFKQFSITDDNSAMKVGFDAVILGSYADAGKVNSVLDLGAGTGIISLMLAQRFPEINIDALEIDKQAFIDLQTNISNSPWYNRISEINDDFINKSFDKSYDCIISNPPFYIPSKSNTSEKRRLARYADELNPNTFCNKAFNILNSSGELIIIYPYELRIQFIRAAFTNDFWLCSQLFISDTDINNPKRVILKFSKIKPVIPLLEKLIIKKKSGGYTSKFEALTKDFYL